MIDEDGERGLVLEWVEPGRLGGEGEEELGRGLATDPRGRRRGFDALPPGSPAARCSASAGSRCRSTPTRTLPGPRSTAAASTSPRPRSPVERGRIDRGCADAVEAVVDRLDDARRPAEPPARVHGDLWSGNVLAGADGRPWLIDPAAHGAHREMDLAMLELFGLVSPTTIAAYEEVWPLADGLERAHRPLAAPAAARPRDPLRRLLRRRGRAERRAATWLATRPAADAATLSAWTSTRLDTLLAERGEPDFRVPSGLGVGRARGPHLRAR